MTAKKLQLDPKNKFSDEPLQYPAEQIADDKLEAKRAIDSSLESLAIEINSTYAEGISLAQRATECMIEVGNLLLTARDKFPGDRQFGQWRKKNVEFSGSHCSRLMAVAREFGTNKDAHILPISQLSELLPAPKTVQEAVIEEAKKSGKTPTVKSVRKTVQDVTPLPEIQTPEQSARCPKPQDPEAIAEKIRQERKSAQESLSADVDTQELTTAPENDSHWDVMPDLKSRLKNSDDSFVIFGITPMFDGTFNPEIFSILYNHYCQEDLTPGQQKKLDQAMADIKRQLYQ